MDDALLAYMIIWGAILTYFLLASIDFGAGFYHLLSLRSTRGDTVREAIRAYVNPRWEVTNVFLVMIVVAAAAFFPALVGVLGTVLLIPVSLLAILFVIRGAFLVFDYYGAGGKWFAAIYALAGLLILPMLSVVLTLIIANPVTSQNGIPSFDIFSPLVNPVTYATALLALSGEILLSGSLALYYDERQEDASFYRRPVLVSAAAVAVLGLVELVLLQANAGYAFDKMSGLAPVLVVTAGAFGVAGYLLWRGSRRRALYAFLLVVAVDAVALLTFAYAHYPYLIYPDVQVSTVLAGSAMLSVLLVVLAVGLAVILPPLLYLNYLFRSERTY